MGKRRAVQSIGMASALHEPHVVPLRAIGHRLLLHPMCNERDESRVHVIEPCTKPVQVPAELLNAGNAVARHIRHWRVLHCAELRDLDPVAAILAGPAPGEVCSHAPRCRGTSVISTPVAVKSSSSPRELPCTQSPSSPLLSSRLPLLATACQRRDDSPITAPTGAGNSTIARSPTSGTGTGSVGRALKRPALCATPLLPLPHLK